MKLPQYSFCPKCGAKLAFKIPNKFDHEKRYTCTKCDFIFYQNSKPTASAIIINDNNEVLVVKRAYEPGVGKYDFPGGFLEYGESPQDGAKREIQEELNVEIEVLDFVGIYMDYYDTVGESTINIYYLARIKSGDPVASSDIDSFEWFAKDQLPTDFAFQNNKDALVDFLKQK
jgi:mutator protein MutT